MISDLDTYKLATPPTQEVQTIQESFEYPLSDLLQDGRCDEFDHITNVEGYIIGIDVEGWDDGTEDSEVTKSAYLVSPLGDLVEIDELQQEQIILFFEGI